MCLDPKALELMRSDTRYPKPLWIQLSVFVEVMWAGGVNSLYPFKGPHEDQVLGYETPTFEEYLCLISRLLGVFGTGNHDP